MKKASARHLMPKGLPHKTGYSDGAREHHSSFKHPGVSSHKESDGPEWRHGKDDDVQMSHPGVPFTDTNPDKHATSVSGIHKGGSNPRLQHVHSMLVRK